MLNSSKLEKRIFDESGDESEESLSPSHEKTGRVLGSISRWSHKNTITNNCKFIINKPKLKKYLRKRKLRTIISI